MRQYLHVILCVIILIFTQQAQATGSKGVVNYSNDAVITSTLTKQFTKNTSLNLLPITITTQNGVVTLSGNVKDKQAFIEAFQLAFTTKGVKSVDIDNLNINRTNTTLTDAYITAKIETAVLKAKILDDESIPLVGINATTVNGIVTITGEVKRNKSIIAILKRANAVQGVKKIISSLHVGKINP